jgi:hypothetical protein
VALCALDGDVMSVIIGLFAVVGFVFVVSVIVVVAIILFRGS